MAGAEISFRKLKLVKIFYKSIMLDERHFVISMISLEKACVRDLDLCHIPNILAVGNARHKTF